MKRRDFIKKGGLAALGLGISPYILPAGTWSAPTGKRIANHVVFCLFAGGIRNLESLQKKEGNLMPGILHGNESVNSEIADGIDPLPKFELEALEKFGTLYTDFRYKSTKTIHFTAHASAIMGTYSNNTELMKPLNFPSVFEYYRRFNSPAMSAINAWWVSDQAGPFTYLNYSDVIGFGPQFGANMIQPTTLFTRSLNGEVSLSDSQMQHISDLQAFFNKHAQVDPRLLNKSQIENTYADRIRIEKLIIELNNRFKSHDFSPWNTGRAANEDIATMYTATEIIKKFQPELLLVNMQHSDIGHSNFTKYCSNLRKADFAVRQLWETIQNTPGMKDDTILIIAPEFGRNLKPNTLRDEFGRLAVDHTGDEMSQKIFCMIVGPPSKVNQSLRVSERGETIDLAPTILKILGVDIPPSDSFLKGRFLEEAFV